ncbi:hypothetical protein NDU88_001536 [Pleurodeles waltl]|uniref:Uncharacterized protein n=1 Tax=Pleurodeles waltl TaxID=8319 RepID=A0AAV7WIL9_PLEWA|nr:hypothetical protein NDU88_001536 [Pleurodeles waltl]
MRAPYLDVLEPRGQKPPLAHRIIRTLLVVFLSRRQKKGKEVRGGAPYAQSLFESLRLKQKTTWVAFLC